MTCYDYGNDYNDTDSELIGIAHSCKHFITEGFPRRKLDTAEGSISCYACKNWNSDGCIINAYDKILKSNEF